MDSSRQGQVELRGLKTLGRDLDEGDPRWHVHTGSPSPCASSTSLPSSNGWHRQRWKGQVDEPQGLKLQNLANSQFMNSLRRSNSPIHETAREAGWDKSPRGQKRQKKDMGGSMEQLTEEVLEAPYPSKMR